MCERGQSAEDISAKVLERLRRLQEYRGYTSTRQPSGGAGQNKRGFLDVVLEGLAADGGLYVPTGKMPHLSLGGYPFLYFVPLLLTLSPEKQNLNGSTSKEVTV